MSEYQYYEFRSIDRALSDGQMRELRAISTRAAISRTSFSNHYEYGDLKANPRDLLVKYFDASLYFAHWLYLEVAFRYPKGAVDVKALRRYTAGHTVDIRSAGSDVVVAMSVETDGAHFDAADDGSSWLSSLMGLRADIASGDERALYLAWLLDVQGGIVDDDAIEPARPVGLAVARGDRAMAGRLPSRRARRVTLARDPWRRERRRRAHAPVSARHVTPCSRVAIAHGRRAAPAQKGSRSNDTKPAENARPANA